MPEERGYEMENRVAMLAIVVEDSKSVEELNHLLHQFSPYIIGRMGVPYKARNISLISVAVDAPADVISTLSGKTWHAERCNIQSSIFQASEAGILKTAQTRGRNLQ